METFFVVENQESRLMNGDFVYHKEYIKRDNCQNLYDLFL